MFMLSGIGALIKGAGVAGAASAGAASAGGATVANAAAAAGVGSAAASTISISSILQGVATVGGLVTAIGAGKAQQQASELAAMDAEAEQSLENLQGISRRRSLKAAAAEAIGETEAAYAASGVDLSTGTAAQAKTDALRELDLGMTSDAGTSMTRLSRLTQRAASHRQAGKRALSLGYLTGLTGVASSAARYYDRG